MFIFVDCLDWAIFFLKINSVKNEFSDSQKEIASFAKAMGHPVRIAIMQYLAPLKSCYFGDIHKELGLSKANVSEHLRILKECGLIHGEIVPPKVKYCVNAENWKRASDAFKSFFASFKNKKKACK